MSAGAESIKVDSVLRMDYRFEESTSRSISRKSLAMHVGEDLIRARRRFEFFGDLMMSIEQGQSRSLLGENSDELYQFDKTLPSGRVSGQASSSALAVKTNATKTPVRVQYAIQRRDTTLSGNY